MNYLVTIENELGMWIEEPSGFATLDEARLYATGRHVEGNVVIYSLQRVED